MGEIDFLAKEVYGRIEPANYLLAMLVVLGSRTPKLYAPIISAVQRLFSYNFISPNEELAASLKLLREDHREFLLLPAEDYARKSFKELYIETLVGLGERDEGLNLSVAKSLSLIWRLDENSIPLSLLPKIFDYILDCMVANRVDDEEKMLKSALLEMFRHTLESYREAFDRKLLHEENSVSLKGLTTKFALVLADAVAIKLDVQRRLGVEDYAIIPPEQSERAFALHLSEEVNEKGAAAGKFGWCTYCRSTANYYCIVNRLPVCSFACKQALANEIRTRSPIQNHWRSSPARRRGRPRCTRATSQGCSACSSPSSATLTAARSCASRRSSC